MLPKIVQKVSSQSSIILRLFAKYTQQNRREMMFYNFKYIFSYLVRMVSKESELEACLRYLQVTHFRILLFVTCSFEFINLY